jgi:hypothetical protein
MGKHEAAAPIWFPNQRVIRTALQVIAGLILAGVAVFGGIATFAPDILAELREILPPAVYAWLVGFVAFSATISAALSKLMTIPGVNDWLTKHTPFGSAPHLIDAGTAADGEASVITDLGGDTTDV